MKKKRYVRRTVQVATLVGTLLVGTLALALIVSQTPWFRGWLRRFALREAGNYVNGTVSIGSLSGNVFYGLELGDVTIDVNGEHVVTLKQVEVSYSLPGLVSQGMTVGQIVVREPHVLLRRDAKGWNIASLVKRQEQEADRQGPRRSVSMPDIEIVDGSLTIDDRAPSSSYRLPSTIDGVNAKAGFAYEPVHYSVTLDHLAFNGHAPDLRVQSLSGRFGTRDDDLNVEKLFVQTAESAVTIDGVIRNYLSHPSLQLTTSAPKLSIPEFAGVVPPLKGYALHPVLDMKASGPQERLELALNTTSEAGVIHGTLTLDLREPDLGVRGNVDVRHLDLSPLLQSPAQQSDITGYATVDITLATAGPKPAVDRLRGHVTFDGPAVTAVGQTAQNVHATVDLAGRRINFNGRGNAYGGSGTGKGSITVASSTGAPTVFDVAGRASHVNLAALPPKLGAPRTTTDLDASAYHVHGSVGPATSVEGTATMETSAIAGGTIVAGTTGEFATTSGAHGLQSLTYAGHGEVRGVNLQKVGEAFQIAALNVPEYDSRINSTFDVKGSGTSVDALQIDATGTATDSQVYGGTIPRVTYETHLANGALHVRADGEFRNFDPARLLKDPKYKGDVSGTVNASFGMANVAAPVTPDAITADGRVTLVKSTLGGQAIDSADIQGEYANSRGVLRQATVKGEAIDVEASGPIAFDRSGQSNVKYHVTSTDLASVGKMVDQPGLSGSAVLDGTVTGNAASLTIGGTLDGSNVGYKDATALDLNSHYTIAVPDLTFAQASVQAQTTGTFVKAAGLEISTLTADTTYRDRTLTFQTHVAEAPSTAQGGGGARQLDASGSAIFHPDHSEIHLPSLALRTQGAEWQLAPGSAAAIEYSADRVQLQGVKFVSGDQGLDIDGTFSLGDHPQLGGIHLAARNVDIAQIEKLAMQNRGFTGRLNATATLNGNASAPDVTGHLSVDNGAFRQFKYQSLTADGTLSNRRIGIDAKLVQTPGVELTAKGTVPLSAFNAVQAAGGGHVAAAAADNIDLHIQSTRIDLGIVQGMTSQVTNVTGTVQADVTVTGSGADPHLGGYVEFQDGAFAVPEAGVRFTGMTTRIELEADRIRVPRFQILDQHGKALTIQGDLAVHEGQAGAVNVTIESDDFKLFDNELGNVHLETHLRLGGEVRKPRLEGEIHTDAARLEIDRILLMLAQPYSEEALPDVVSAETLTKSSKGADEATQAAFAQGRELQANEAAQAEAAHVAVAPTTGLFAASELDVRVVAPDNLIVRGSDLRPGGPSASAVGSVNATLGADVRIMKKVDGAVTLTGNANTVRGFYEFQGRRFTIVRDGTVQFRGTSDLNPTVDLSAERLIPNTGVTARVHVTGTLQKPRLTLTSDPPLDESDILSLIVFNRSVNELGTGERASLAETAGGIASGFVASALGRSIGKALDVDLFEITTTDPETGESAGGVTLGKQMSDKVFVQFRQQFGARSFTEFMLEYQLAKYLRVDVTTAPETSAVANHLTQRRVERAGIDLIFFFSY